jgi:drug/metabolite transporter (DMT)-like permease
LPATALLLVLASAALHALWNALLKGARDPEAASLGILAAAILATASLLPWVPGPLFPRPAALAWALTAGIAEGCYFGTLGRALARAPLGWSYAWMRGGALLLVWPVSVLCLGEALQPLSAPSVAAVCLGLALMGARSVRGVGPDGLFWAGVTGVAIAGYTLCYKASLAHGANPVALFATSMAVALLLQLAARRHAPNRFGLAGAGRAGLGLTVLGGLLCSASFLLYLKALALQGAGAVTTLRNTSIVFALVFARVLGEKPPPRHWAGAVLVAAGAAGLAWG